MGMFKTVLFNCDVSLSAYSRHAIKYITFFLHMLIKVLFASAKSHLNIPEDLSYLMSNSKLRNRQEMHRKILFHSYTI